MLKLKCQNYIFKLKTIGFLVIVLSFELLVLSSQKAQAQDISLSITPPILEVMIKPGKEITQRYLLSNNGRETSLFIKLIPFSAFDEYGNVKLEDISIYNDINISNWFKVQSGLLSENQKIFLPRGGNAEIILTISPPENAPEGDYYLTLIFETDSSAFIEGQGSTSNAQIGTNILLTISKNGIPLKKAEITKFSAPKIIDSLGKIVYFVKVKNTGSAFFKPVGKIQVNSLIGSSETLSLAPLNILSSSIREIPCAKDEQLIRCLLPKKVLLGIYNAKLKFTLDDGKETYEAQTLTFAFPFSITAAFLISFIIIKMIFNKVKK